MTEAEFLTIWHSERAQYAAWGDFINCQITAGLRAAHENIDIDVFLKIPPKSRIKEDDSLLGKAFHRSKAYQNPYKDIEDKVGVRFVVLLTSDISTIQKIIEQSDFWIASLDKDFEAEREIRPMEFSYQSKHFVLKAKADIELSDGIIVSKGTPCEVQVRTLLQHAHSELTHDNIYKREPGVEVSKKVERTVAKSMALIEAVDDYFLAAIDEIAAGTKLERDALEDLTTVYVDSIGLRPNVDKTNSLVLHAFRDKLDSTLRTKLIEMLSRNSGIQLAIKKRFDNHYIFRQPWILLAYLMVDTFPSTTAERWPLTHDELRPVYTDLGKAFPARVTLT